MADKILYVSDLDDTLLGKDSHLSPFTLETINRLIQEGLLFTFASARSLTSAAKAIRGLNLRLPVITYNGTFIQDAGTGKILHGCTFGAEQRRAIMEILEGFRVSPLVYAFVDGVERLSWRAGTENAGMKNYLAHRKGDPRLNPIPARTAADTAQVPPKSSAAPVAAPDAPPAVLPPLYAGDIFYFTCIGTYEEFLPVRHKLSTVAGVSCSLFPEPGRPGEYWCEIMPAGASKAQAVLWLKKILGVHKVITFGDAQNDIPMFEVSDECYAVANACDELKQLASGIIQSNAGDGVAKFLASFGCCSRHPEDRLQGQ